MYLSSKQIAAESYYMKLESIKSNVTVIFHTLFINRLKVFYDFYYLYISCIYL